MKQNISKFLSSICSPEPDNVQESYFVTLESGYGSLEFFVGLKFGSGQISTFFLTSGILYSNRITCIRKLLARIQLQFIGIFCEVRIWFGSNFMFFIRTEFLDANRVLCTGKLILIQLWFIGIIFSVSYLIRVRFRGFFQAEVLDSLRVLIFNRISLQLNLECSYRFQI